MNRQNQKRKVAIFKSEIFWTPHLGTGLELIQRHLDAGDEIISFVCNAFFQYCDQNLNGSSERCSICVKKRTKGISLLNAKIREISIQYPKKEYNYLNANMTLSAAMKITHHYFDVGVAVASSLISRKRDAYLSVKENFQLFNILINNAAGLYDFFLEQLQIEKPDLVYIFNGRFEYDRALLRACEKLNIKYYIYDGAGSVDKYMLIENAMIHDIKDFHERVMATWDKSQLLEEEKHKKSEAFFLERRYGSQKSRHYFVKNQESELLPSNWNNEKVNIPIFLSSEDEFAAIGDQWKMTLYQDQLDGLKQLINSLDEKSHNIRFYIRIHPNSNNTNPGFIKSVFELQSDWVEVIAPNSPISTYKLMLSSPKIITFGSTVGIEASYWGIPSINLGKSFYMHMGVTHTPNNHEEAVQMILNKTLPSISNKNIYKYGFHNMEFGEIYRYYQPKNNYSGNFRGCDLHQYNLTYLNRLKNRIKPIIPKSIILFYRKIKQII